MANTQSREGREGRAIRKRTLMLVQLAALTAIIFVLDVTKLGYLPLTPPGVSIMMVPVAVGAMIFGKKGGLIMGAMFGISSMVQCFTGSVLGMVIFSVNPYLTVLLNVGVRVLVGFLAGWIFESLSKHDRTKIWSYGATACLASVLNSALYVTFLVLFFSGSLEVQQIFTGLGNLETIGMFYALVVALLLLSMVFEAVACTVVAGTTAKILNKYVNNR